MVATKLHVTAAILALSLSACQSEAAPDNIGTETIGLEETSTPDDNMPQNMERDMTSSFNLPGCEEIAVAAPDAAAMADQFDKTYPQSLIGVESVEDVNLSQGDMENIVTYLTCAAARSNYDIGVMESSLALFDSKRHGDAAFAALSQLADSSNAIAPDARQYSDSVKQFLSGPVE